MPATAPRPRSPAQIEAARRNGARSRGPVTAEGKARASRNALKHGLAALEHLVLDGEDAAELEAMTARLLSEVGPESEIEARLVRRMAVAFWKGERAERIEVALFAAAPKVRPPAHGFQWEKADPLTTFDVKRFNAVRGYQAQQGRELSRCLKELRQLRREPLESCTDEPDATLQNKPGNPPTANDDAPIPRYPGGFDLDDAPRNEPGNQALPANDDAVHPRHTGDNGLRNEPSKPVPTATEAELEQGRRALAVWAQARLRRLRAEQAGSDPWGPGGLLDDEAEDGTG
jgi:hypothetical protein